MSPSGEQGLQHTAACKELLSTCFDLLNRLNGKPIPQDSWRLNDAHTFAKKTVTHVETALHLASVTPQPDHGSIAILVRAAYESLLLFHYLFIDPASHDERRYEQWKLCGLRARSAIKGFVDSRPAEEIAVDRTVMSDLENEVRAIVSNDGMLKKHGRSKKFNPDKYWKWKPSWGTLAVVAGFEAEKANSIYAYLCAYAHGDSWALLQIDQAGRENHERSLSETSIMFGCVILASLIDSYPEVLRLSPQSLPERTQQLIAKYRDFCRDDRKPKADVQAESGSDRSHLG